MKSGSIWNPSRVPTSQIVTRAGSFMASSRLPGVWRTVARRRANPFRAGRHPSAEEMLDNLLADHETLIRQLRADADAAASKYQDMGTNDFLTGLMEKHEKMAWMLRAFQEGKTPSRSR